MVDGRLVGLAQGAVRTAAVEEGTPTLLAELGDGLAGALAVVPDLVPGAGGGDSGKGSAGGMIAAMAAVLAAGAVVAVGTVGKSRVSRPRSGSRSLQV